MNYLAVFVFCAFSYAEALFGIRSKEPALKIRFDIGLDPGVSFYINIPLTASELEAEGWAQVARPPQEHMSELMMYCQPDDVTVCPLFDDTGYIAGLQIAFPVDDVSDTVTEDISTLGFRRWLVAPTKNSEPKEHWFNTQYFVSPQTLAKSSEHRRKLHSKGQVLYDGGVWLNHVDGSLLKISSNGTKLKGSIFKEQGCLPGMGHHYFYNMTVKSNCTVYPWFTLVNQDDLVATGLIFLGKLQEPGRGRRDWFERPPTLAAHVIAPRAPPCVYKYAADPGIVSMHIYYVKFPWEIGCLLE